MACEHLEEGRFVRCRAVSGTLIPSLYERERYCRSGHESCPTKQLYAIRKTPVQQEEYYGLWAGSEDEQPLAV